MRPAAMYPPRLTVARGVLPLTAGVPRPWVVLLSATTPPADPHLDPARYGRRSTVTLRRFDTHAEALTWATDPRRRHRLTWLACLDLDLDSQVAAVLNC